MKEAMESLYQELTADGYCSPAWTRPQTEFTVGDVRFTWLSDRDYPTLLASWTDGSLDDFDTYELEVDADLESVKTFVHNRT